jgi:hypothetical protein
MLVLISITELFYPLLVGKPLFGSFRKNVANAPQTEKNSLHEKVSKAKAKVKEVKDIQDEVNDNFKSAEELKAEADDLLNNLNK